METRSVPRITAQLKLSVKLGETPEQSINLDKGNCFEATIADISEGGMCLIIKKYYLPKGAILELSVDGTPFELKSEMKFNAEVRYCNNHGVNVYKCGIKFIEMTEEFRNAIKMFCGKYDKRQSPRINMGEGH